MKIGSLINDEHCKNSSYNFSHWSSLTHETVVIDDCLLNDCLTLSLEGRVGVSNLREPTRSP
jgi:hypothetical protein